MQRRHWQTHFSIKNLLIGLVVWLSVSIVLYYLYINLTIKQIIIKGNETKQTIYGITNLYNKNLFLLDTNKTQEIIYLNNPNLAEVEIVKQYPNQLQITIHQQAIIAQIKTSIFFLLIDNKQRIVKKSRILVESLPVINYYQNLSSSIIKVGERLESNDIEYAIYFTSLLKDIGYSVNTIDINGTDMLGLNLSSWKLFVSLDKSKEDQAELLKIIIRNFKVEGKTAKTIDLRFSKPIVEF
ncbi:hypothetical protein COZ39_01770 [Candidatus Roizmanbacteria bacterium CG_4_10_14_3_um_filter_33_21]|uniref:POTRA domain-containing protein n=2 Tax=Candidatus Roizmaniibacteriota TaxID=1752723 RepID=A0A2H0C4Z3_9BACT|nr:MAG: hypothetical protein COW96_02410 [Candidatus Roizmanbacteria bacterium CG22_combo_CG10-13_8_21_14_all_33_16]PIX73796.1 MAG: hypothetical protein COZ39_01770 [Candidatus Roizmanbacteria bacterium CG_4_10_14_3_um_filter_33_21]